MEGAVLRSMDVVPDRVRGARRELSQSSLDGFGSGLYQNAQVRQGEVRAGFPPLLSRIEKG